MAVRVRRALKIFYNGTALHELGHVFIAAETVDYEPAPPALPQRARRTLRVRIETDLPGVGDYAQHRALVVAGLTAMRAAPAGLLVWTDDAGTTTHLSQPVVLAGTNLPESPNEWGTWEQHAEFAFAFEQPVTSQALATTWTPTGGAAVSLGVVENFGEDVRYVRPSEWRKVRERGTGRAALAGKWHADPSLGLAARQAALAAHKATLDAALLTAADGTLVHGAFFNRKVRIEARSVRVNQAEWCLEWSLDATFTQFPDEATAQVASFTVKDREDIAGGQAGRTLAGRIIAPTEVSALAKLDALVAAYGTGHTLVDREVEPSLAHTTDGDDFLELGFNVTFRKLSGTIVNETLGIEAAEDVPAGWNGETWRGTATCRSASSWAAAYALAHARAVALGGGKHQFLLRSRIAVDDQQQRANRVVTGDYVVTVNFSFEYRLKGTRAFLELTATANSPRLGQWSLDVAGSVTCATSAEASGYVDALRAAYKSQGFLRDEVRSEKSQRIATAGGVPVGSATTPPLLTSGHATINTGEAAATVPAGFTQVWERTEFRFTVWLPRAAGADTAVKYEMATELDHASLTKTTGVRGEVWGATRADCDAALAHLQAGFTELGLGEVAQSTRGELREKFIGNPASPTLAEPAGTVAAAESYRGYLVGFTFADRYDGVIAGETAVLQCSLREAVRFSGARIVVAPTAFGRDVLQECGWESGRRTVRGTVVAATETAARAYMATALALPWWVDPAENTVKALPPEQEGDWEFAFKALGVARGGSANYRVFRLSFSREWIVTHYDYPQEPAEE